MLNWGNGALIWSFSIRLKCIDTSAWCEVKWNGMVRELTWCHYARLLSLFSLSLHRWSPSSFSLSFSISLSRLIKPIFPWRAILQVVETWFSMNNKYSSCYKNSERRLLNKRKIYISLYTLMIAPKRIDKFRMYIWMWAKRVWVGSTTTEYFAANLMAENSITGSNGILNWY